MSDIEKIINEAWENKDNVNQDSDQSLKDTINQMIDDLDSGKVRVAEKINGEWVTHQHIKKAIMLSFRIYPMACQSLFLQMSLHFLTNKFSSLNF